jgi:hypothetical protein
LYKKRTVFLEAELEDVEDLRVEGQDLLISEEWRFPAVRKHIQICEICNSCQNDVCESWNPTRICQTGANFVYVLLK